MRGATGVREASSRRSEASGGYAECASLQRCGKGRCAARRAAARQPAGERGTVVSRERVRIMDTLPAGVKTHSPQVGGEEKATYRSAHHSRATAFGVNSGGGRSHRAGRRRWKGLLRPDGFSRRRVPLARRGVSVWRGIDWALRLERTKPQ